MPTRKPVCGYPALGRQRRRCADIGACGDWTRRWRRVSGQHRPTCTGIEADTRQKFLLLTQNDITKSVRSSAGFHAITANPRFIRDIAEPPRILSENPRTRPSYEVNKADIAMPFPGYSSPNNQHPGGQRAWQTQPHLPPQDTRAYTEPLEGRAFQSSHAHARPVESRDSHGSRAFDGSMEGRPGREGNKTKCESRTPKIRTLPSIHPINDPSKPSVPSSSGGSEEEEEEEEKEEESRGVTLETLRVPPRTQPTMVPLVKLQETRGNG